MKTAEQHNDLSHKHASIHIDLERETQMMTKLLQHAVVKHQKLCVLVRRLEEREVETSHSLTEQVKENQQLQLKMEELHRCLEEKDKLLTQANQTIAFLRNKLKDMHQQLPREEIQDRTFQEWLQDEDNWHQIQLLRLDEIKEEVGDYGHLSLSSPAADINTDIKSELIQEEANGLNIASVVGSEPARGDGSSSEPARGDGGSSSEPARGDGGSSSEPGRGEGSSSEPGRGDGSSSEPARGDGSSSEPARGDGGLSADPVRQAQFSRVSVKLVDCCKTGTAPTATEKRQDGEQHESGCSWMQRFGNTGHPCRRICCIHQDCENLMQMADSATQDDLQGVISQHTAMSTFLEQMLEIVPRALPNIPEATHEIILDRIVKYGATSTQDLQYLKEDDFTDLLPLAQRHHLIEVFHTESQAISLSIKILPSTTTEVSSSNSLFMSPSGSENSSSSSQPLSQPTIDQPQFHTTDYASTTSQPIWKSWPESFKVPWDHMPAEIRTAISSCRRPSPVVRRQMVRIICDEMRKYEPNPTRAQCLVVCRNIIRQYPESFADQRADRQLIDGGYMSLLIQVKNRIENLNRASGIHLRRSVNNGRKRGPTDTYGCTRFQPTLPPGETEESMESKRQQLQGIFSRDGTAGSEKQEVTQLMELTFYLQRSHINALPIPTIETLKTKWPYLFSQKGLYSHFQLLTGIPVLHSLELAMKECGKTIVEMFKSKPTNARMKELLRQRADDDVELSYRVIHLLLSHFSEDVSGLIVLADGNATAADLNSSFSAPATPRLILLGESVSHIRHWMISIEGQIICEGIQPTFVTGLACLFSCFYVFNLHYQEEAACTLEFIQRRFVGINPEQGTKAAKGKKRIVDSRVASLLCKLMDFQ